MSESLIEPATTHPPMLEASATPSASVAEHWAELQAQAAREIAQLEAAERERQRLAALPWTVRLFRALRTQFGIIVVLLLLAIIAGGMISGFLIATSTRELTNLRATLAASTANSITTNTPIVTDIPIPSNTPMHLQPALLPPVKTPLITPNP